MAQTDDYGTLGPLAHQNTSIEDLTQEALDQAMHLFTSEPITIAHRLSLINSVLKLKGDNATKAQREAFQKLMEKVSPNVVSLRKEEDGPSPAIDHATDQG